MRRGQTVDAHIYATPDPAVVARIISTKGVEAAQERWHWCEKRTLMAIARSGRARTGIASKATHVRTSALDGLEAVAVEATHVLGSMAAVDHALGVGKNATRALYFKRGLDLPKGHGERVAEGCLGRRINAGDATAVAEREAKRAHARAVCDVLVAALALVPDQPMTGRYILPPVDDALRDALAGLPQSAVEAVFPDIAPVAAPAPAEDAVTLAIPLPDPVPAEEVPAVTETIPPTASRRLRWPDEATVRADHADGEAMVVLAARYGVPPAALYSRWRRYGLAGTGRLAGFLDARREVSARVKAAQADAMDQMETAADIPAEPAAQEPVAPPRQIDPYGALSFEDAVAEIAFIEGAAPLGTRDLARAVDLAVEKGLDRATAIAWIRADIRAVAEARVIMTTDQITSVADEVFHQLMLADERGPRQ